MDDILARLREWVGRLVTEFTRIVGGLAQATSFSISVGAARARGSGWKRCLTRARRKGGSTRWPA